MAYRVGTDNSESGGPTVTIAARIPTSVAARIDDMAQRSGLGRAEIVRLALTRMPDDLIPPELYAAADVMRDLRRVR